MSNPSSTSGSWKSKKEHGSARSIKLVVNLYRFFGPRLVRPLLFPITLFYFCIDANSRAASKEYLIRVNAHATKLKKPAPAVNLFSVFRHFHAFAWSILDTVQAWNGEITATDIKWSGRELMHRQIEGGKGGVILSAHFGSIEVCRATCKYLPGLSVKSLMYLDNSQNYRRILAEFSTEADKNIIILDKLAIEQLTALTTLVENGEFLGMLADRPSVRSSDRILYHNFLGAQAAFPEGPFLMADLLKQDVFCVFAYRDRHQDFQIRWQKLTRLSTEDRKNRKDRLMHLLTQYVAFLEDICLEAPLQWFNFSPFWPDIKKTADEEDMPNAA